MGLTQTGLTAHCKADDTSYLFKTYVNTGIHTGTPSANNDIIEVWDNVAGIADQAWMFSANVATYPRYKPAANSLMKYACLSFDGRRIHAYNQNGTAQKFISSFFTNSDFTIMAAFYPQAIVSTAANAYQGEPLIADFGNVMGLFMRDISGVKKISGYNNDNTLDEIHLNITTGKTYIVTFQHYGGNLRMSLIDETHTKTSATPVASGNSWNMGNQLAIGNTGGIFGNFLMGEFAVWNTGLTGSDLTDSETYFSRWLPDPRFNALLISPV